MDMPDVDSVSGGISCVVEVYCFGIQKATTVDTIKPIEIARRKNPRRPQSKRSCSACHSCDSSSGTSGSETSPTTGGAASGCDLVAVCIISFMTSQNWNKTKNPLSMLIASTRLEQSPIRPIP